MKADTVSSGSGEQPAVYTVDELNCWEQPGGSG